MIGVTTLFLPMASGEKQTIMYLTLIIISMTAVIRSCIPFNVLRGFICVTMICGTFGALVILPGLFEISAMSVAMWGHFLDRKSYIGCRTADHIKFKRTAGRIQSTYA